MRQRLSAPDIVAITLSLGAVLLLLVIATMAFGRAFYLAVVTHTDIPISDNATQLIQGLGATLVGGAVGFISGVSAGRSERKQSEANDENQ